MKTPDEEAEPMTPEDWEEVFNSDGVGWGTHDEDGNWVPLDNKQE